MKNKKMIFGFLAVLAIAAMAAWNVSFGSKTDMLSDVALANVEALAEGEGESSWWAFRRDNWDSYYECYYQCMMPSDYDCYYYVGYSLQC